jgi:hypothetical protein
MFLGSALAPAARADQVLLNADLTWTGGGYACLSCSLELVISMTFDNITGAIELVTLNWQVIAYPDGGLSVFSFTKRRRLGNKDRSKP